MGPKSIAGFRKRRGRGAAGDIVAGGMRGSKERAAAGPHPASGEKDLPPRHEGHKDALRRRKGKSRKSGLHRRPYRSSLSWHSFVLLGALCALAVNLLDLVIQFGTHVVGRIVAEAEIRGIPH